MKCLRTAILQIESNSDITGARQSLYRGERRIDIVEIMDQWYGHGYRYIKVRGHDSSVYILRLDEASRQCKLIMFSAARATEYQRKYHDMARSAQSRQ
jgi:hypothetical protein